MTKRWDAILARLPHGQCTMVEIGVWRGENAYHILSIHPKVLMHLVDPYTSTEYGDAYWLTGSKDSRTNQATFDATYAATKQRLAPFADRACLHRMRSEAFAPFVAIQSLDMVFIDGDHSYEGCRVDIETWWPKIRIGGWFGGHDYMHERFPGVTRAVDEFATAIKAQVERGLDHTWWIRCG